jgi:hypothetical protein
LGTIIVVDWPADELPQTFDNATKTFSSDTPSLPSVIPAMDAIDKELTKAVTSSKYSPAIQAALSLGKRVLNKYYSLTDHSDVYRIAMGMFILSTGVYCIANRPFPVLHPTHKLEYFRKAKWQKEWVDNAKKIVRREFKNAYAALPSRSDDSDDDDVYVCLRCHILFHYLITMLGFGE